MMCVYVYNVHWQKRKSIQCNGMDSKISLSFNVDDFANIMVDNNNDSMKNNVYKSQFKLIRFKINFVFIFLFDLKQLVIILFLVRISKKFLNQQCT